MILRRRKQTRAATLTAALLSSALLLLAAPQLSARRQANEAVYTLHVTVTDEKGNIIEGLGREAFTVFDGGRRLEIKSFSDADEPASVAVVLDASRSMQRRDTARVRNALLRFFRQCHAESEFSVGVFDDRQQLLVERSNDAASLLSALDRYAASKTKGLTAVYDALYLAMHHVGAGRHARRAVVLVTDGGDNSSRYTFRDVERAARESDVTLYAVALHEEGFAHDLTTRSVLEELAEPTGGFVFPANDERQLNEALVSVAQTLRGRYALGVVPATTSRADGWREVRVKVSKGRGPDGKLHKLTARTRKGFYWPTRTN